MLQIVWIHSFIFSAQDVKLEPLHDYRAIYTENCGTQTGGGEWHNFLFNSCEATNENGEKG